MPDLDVDDFPAHRHFTILGAVDCRDPLCDVYQIQAQARAAC